MLTHPYVTTLRTFLAREDGDTMSQVLWSVGLILLAGALVFFLGPEISDEWAEFVGDPTGR
jgi:hypothetical protein